MKKTIIIFSLLGILVLNSCYEEEVGPSVEYSTIGDLNLLRTGQVMEYQVDSTFYVESFVDSVRTSTLYYKEVVTEQSTDAEGNNVYTVEQSLRRDTTEPYIAFKTFLYRVSDDELVQQKDNAPLLFLKTPVLEEIEWNAIKYTNTDFLQVAQLDPVQKIWNSIYSKVDSSYTPTKAINGSTTAISNAIYVQLADIEDGGTADYTDRIHFDYVFAKGIGIVYKLEEAYVIRSSIKNRRGYKLEYHLISYE